MKLKVDRQLSQGRYQISVEVSDFTPDELMLMSKFGVPRVSLRRQFNAHQIGNVDIPLNQIREGFVSFPSESAAKEYEAKLRDDIRVAVETVRGWSDDFTSSEEIEI